MWFAPNIATMIDVLTRPDLRRLFGGGLRFTASLIITIIFVTLLAPIMWASHTLFLTRLLLGRTVGWGAQARDDHAVPWSLALRHFWPQTLIGLAPVLLLGRGRAVGDSLCACSSPAARSSRSRSRWRPLRPRSGAALIALGLDRLPEETAPPPELRALKLPAIELSQRGA